MADSYGHVYIGDLFNSCVHMFSVDDGSYMGAVVTRKDSIDHLRCLSWCNQTSSLILASCQDIKLVKVDAGIGSIGEQSLE